ncbi:hypothetical protein [Flagellimonas flava]|uniref:Uncharacterized protein n=1 Tax=Flagellimonas flava TaxID=570519 RepID=A0A1M5LLP4_9FLAO|nr:hypothetical protein [Allomuricauda flava]SHG66034.1 hypothetical protein SAMN04488116_1979 [Allomuricauda flava]
MAPISILEEIQNFWESNSHSTLELTFETLEITLFNHGKYVNNVVREEAELILQKSSDPTLLKMDVVDNLVFPFMFTFNAQEALSGQTTQMQKLPRPLGQGGLHIISHSLVLEFTIDSPSEELGLKVQHQYRYNKHFSKT